MKRQALALIINKQSERQILLSTGLALVAISSNAWLMAGAQSQSSYLPPEVIPVNSAIQYNSGSAINNVQTNQVPGIASPAPAAQPTVQSAQEARQSIFSSLMGTNVYPQFNGQNNPFNQMGNMAGNMAGIQTLGQNSPQTLSPNGAQTLSSNPVIGNDLSGQSNLISPSQYNNTISTYSTQTQTLTGSSNTPSTSQPRTSAGFSGIAGPLALAAGSGASLSTFQGGGGIYNAAYLGAGLLNFGIRNLSNF